MVVCSPRRVRLIAESKLKNDKVDAEVLARLVRLDPEFLKPIQHRSEEAQLLRGNLKVRSAMVEARTKWINTVRGLLRSFGYKVSGKAPRTFVDRVDQMELPDELRAVIDPLLEQLDLLTGEIDRRKSIWRKWSRTCRRSIIFRSPGRPVVATYFVLTIDDPTRFSNSRDVASFFGLRPSMRESASITHFGRITKEGDPEMRRLLVQAAHACLRTKADTELKTLGSCTCRTQRKRQGCCGTSPQARSLDAPSLGHGRGLSGVSEQRSYSGSLTTEESEPGE